MPDTALASVLFSIIFQKPGAVDMSCASFFAEGREVTSPRSFSQWDERAFEHQSVGLCTHAFGVLLSIAVPVPWKMQSESDHLGESSTHKSWLMLSLWLQCEELLAFTHLQGGRGRG